MGHHRIQNSYTSTDETIFEINSLIQRQQLANNNKITN